MRFILSLMAVSLAVGVSGCNLADKAEVRQARTPSAPNISPVDDSPIRIGDPYVVGGQLVTPADQADYDEVGYASWYGGELIGRNTASGEPFQPAWISAAHRSLPMPSYVEVTRLDTGKTILVRINDRGPADPRRLIDLSAGAAEQLGIAEGGIVPVRVRRTNPVETERLALRSGRAVPARLDTPESLLEILRERAGRLPSPQPGMSPPENAALMAQTTLVSGAQMPPSASAAREATHFIVQIATFASRSRADALARRLGATVAVSGSLHRVRAGPFATRAEAEAAVNRYASMGQPGAVIQRAP